MKELWQKRIAEIVRKRPKGRTFAAFNLNIDVVARVTPESVRRLVELTPELDWGQVAQVDVDALQLRSHPRGVCRRAAPRL